MRRGPALLIAAFLLVGCGPGGVRVAGDSAGVSSGSIEGSGSVRAEDRPVQGFDRVELATSGALTLTQSGSESLRIEADDNILPLLTSEVRGGTLVLGVRPNTSFSNASIAYTVTVASLEAVDVSGSGTATLLDVGTSALSVAVSGSGTVTSSGRADDLSVQIAGSGGFDGADTASRTATVDISGSGAVVVRVSDRLTASIAGSGSVEYIGSPVVEETVSGSGSVGPR